MNIENQCFEKLTPNFTLDNVKLGVFREQRKNLRGNFLN